MTKRQKSKSEKKKLSRGQMLFCVMSVVAMLLTFKLPEVAIEAMSEGMTLCIQTVIPALFPFMVFSELFISSGAAEYAGRYLGAPLCALFGISRDGSAALMLGLLCGFPIGSKSAISLYERGRISRGELEHILSFCNTPSSAFLISAVGVSLFGSRQIGVMLYISHVISACCAGLIGRIFFSKKKRKREYYLGATGCNEGKTGVVSSLTNAVSRSAQGMLLICAFVIFFSAVVGYLRYFASRTDMPCEIVALIFGFFEMTGGISTAAQLTYGLAIPVSALISGWSGLSVAFQFAGICGEHDISLKPYFLSKLFVALLNAVVFSALCGVFVESIRAGNRDSVSSLLILTGSPMSLISLTVFFCGCAPLISKRKPPKTELS